MKILLNIKKYSIRCEFDMLMYTYLVAYFNIYQASFLISKKNLTAQDYSSYYGNYGHSLKHVLFVQQAISNSLGIWGV